MHVICHDVRFQILVREVFGTSVEDLLVELWLLGLVVSSEELGVIRGVLRYIIVLLLVIQMRLDVDQLVANLGGAMLEEADVRCQEKATHVVGEFAFRSHEVIYLQEQINISHLRLEYAGVLNENVLEVFPFIIELLVGRLQQRRGLFIFRHSQIILAPPTRVRAVLNHRQEGLPLTPSSQIDLVKDMQYKYHRFPRLSMRYLVFTKALRMRLNNILQYCMLLGLSN